MDTNGFDYDYIIIGSGFGGSVSALRLTEKGYKVAVLEMGKRWRPEDFRPHNWDLRRFMWFPKVGFYGIQQTTFLKDVIVFHGAGVGGGSLNYANTHLVPPDPFFNDPQWSDLGDWKRDLAPHYETAKKMLGSVPSPVLCDTDHMLMDIAKEMGREDTFHRVNVGIFFGKPGEKVSDPYFGGEGPDRKGCTLCGNCMIGCRFDAKNTLDKNYLYLAEKRGAKIFAETMVTDVRPLGAADGSDGYQIVTRQSTATRKPPKVWKARGVVFSAGVMGTVRLLLKCKEGGSLPRLSEKLGHVVRTNNEAITTATKFKSDDDGQVSKGIAITSGFYPNDQTHIEMVRYGPGADGMAFLASLMVDGGLRWLGWLKAVARHPLRFLRTLIPFGWSRKTAIVLTMQPLSSTLGFKLVPRWFGLSKTKRMQSYQESGSKVPTYIPVANEVTRKIADKINGYPGSILPEVIFNTCSTAHILGGAAIGGDPSRGVIDKYNHAFGYKNLMVVDGSMIPANLGVNPSLTITALSEHAMGHMPARSAVWGEEKGKVA